MLVGKGTKMQFPYWVEVYSERFFPDLTSRTTPLKLVGSPTFEMVPKRVFRVRMPKSMHGISKPDTLKRIV